MQPRSARLLIPLLLVGALAVGCGTDTAKLGVEEAAREGLRIPVAGLDYNVFITRQLNLRIPPDNAYYKGPEQRPGEALYGVFMQVCNRGDRPARATDDFEIVDNQGNTFKPTPLPRDNPFAYHPGTLRPNECIPEEGSIAQLGPTAGAMLLFRLPLANTENRPLELIIRPPAGAGGAERRVKLDI